MKQKGRQDDCPGRYWERRRQASAFPVTTRAVTLTTFPFLRYADNPPGTAHLAVMSIVVTQIAYNRGHVDGPRGDGHCIVRNSFQLLEVP